MNRAIVSVTVILLLTNSSVFADNTFRSSVLNGYYERCTEVLSGKGFDSTVVKQECGCEVEHLGRIMSTAEMRAAEKRAAAGNAVLAHEEIQQLKAAISVCQKRYLKE